MNDIFNASSTASPADEAREAKTSAREALKKNASIRSVLKSVINRNQCKRYRIFEDRK